MAERPSAVISRVAASVGGRGLSVGPKPGSFESVRLINPNSFSVRGEFHTPSFRFEPLRPRQLNALRATRVEPQTLPQPVAEVPRPKSVERVQPQPVRGEIIFFPNVRPLEIRPASRVIPSPIEYQRLANRVRVIQRSMAIRHQARAVINPEVSSSVRAQAEPRARTQTAPEQKISTSEQTEPQVIRKTASLLGTQKAAATALENLRRKVVEITAVDKDHQTNQARKEALHKAFDDIQAETGEDQVDGNLLGERAGIEGDRYKSEYFSQIGEPKRTDYSQKRTRIRLEQGFIKRDEIPEIVEEYTAVRRAKNPVDAPTPKQFEQVVKPTDLVFDGPSDEQVLRKELVYEDTVTRIFEDKKELLQAVTTNDVNTQKGEEGKAITNNNIVALLPDIFSLVELPSLSPLDSRVDNSTDIFERRAA